MQTQIFMATWNPEINGTHLLAAIIALACVLFVELIGIAVVICKLIGARRRRRRAQEEKKEPEVTGSYEYALAPVILGAIPQYTYSLITILSIAVAAGALILLGLLIAVRANGYDFLSRAKIRRADKQDDREPVEEAPVYVAPARVDAHEETDEEEMIEETVEDAPVETVVSYEEAYVAEETDEDASADADEPVVYEEHDDGDAETEDEVEASVEETADEPADEPVADVVEETVEETAEETVEEAVDEPVVVSGEVIPAAPKADTVSTVSASESVQGQSGQGPYKVVEKHVTETYREIIKEVPAPAPAPAPAENVSTGSNTAEELLAKISDLIDHKIEQEKAATGGDSVPTFAKADADADADEVDEDVDTDEDEDEDDADDAADGEAVDADDIDDEENEIADDRFTGNERILGIDEETGCYIVAHYRKSFEAKLIQARPNIKKYYSELKNALLSFKGTKSRVSWTADSFHNGRTPLAKINVKTRILELYLAIDPATLEGTVYRGKDVGSKKKYADTPFQYKLRTPRKFKWAMELVQRMCEEHGLTPIDIEHVAYDELYPFDTTDNLVDRKLIKEYIRQEKPATTFELADDHVPTVPDEDASVIPANANFTWEFDNDKMNEVEPEPEILPEPEVVEEEPVAEEPAVEETVAEEPPVQETPAPATVYKETVKVTEMRYTERYYANGEPPVTTVYTSDKMLDVPAQAQLPTAEEISEELREEVETIADLDEETLEGTEEAYEETEETYEEEPEETYEEETEESYEEETEESYEEADESYEENTEESYEDADEERFFVDDNEETYEETYEEAESSYEDTDDSYDEGTEESCEEEADESYEDSEETEQSYEDGEVDDGEDTEETYEEESEQSYEYGEDTDADAEESAEESYEEQTYEDVEETYTEKKIVTNPSKAVVDVCRLEEHFPSGATINLDVLKEMGLVVDTARTLSVYASKREMTKAFTVEANKFTVEAVGVIDAAGGDAIMLT